MNNAGRSIGWHVAEQMRTLLVAALSGRCERSDGPGILFPDRPKEVCVAHMAEWPEGGECEWRLAAIKLVSGYDLDSDDD
jgi:hypothetical protein